jgi:4-amino-4-deoxy-L-arabinose transferase-like glycosyltransferase
MRLERNPAKWKPVRRQIARQFKQSSPRAVALGIALLILVRFVASAWLPLSADEAYYWLWSKHLAWGYYDHPPVIAFAIRAGATIFGDTSFGVRFVPLVLSAIASWAVWRAGAILLKREDAGALACLFFNLTPMVAIEAMAATPDAPAMAASALFLLALAKAEQTRKGYWWLVAGVAAGAGLLSKYTILFAGAGAFAWLLFDPRLRRLLLTPWPYAGALVALVLFLPNLLWNSTHHWMTFALQFGRVGEGHFTARYLVEFLAAQLGMATPFIFALGAFGLFARRKRDASLLAKAVIWPAVVYFVVHALRDRVQGNWPSFLYPAFAILAVEAASADWRGWKERVMRVCRVAAIPVASLMLVFLYAQAIFDVVPRGRADPFGRLLGFGLPQMADDITLRAETMQAGAVLTTDYETAAWLKFYLPSLPMIDLGEDYRWADAPVPSASLLAKPLLYVALPKRDLHAAVAKHFAKVELCGQTTRARDGITIETYFLYCVERSKGPAGRLP